MTSAPPSAVYAARLRALIVVSGVVALVYQSLWMRQLSLVLGSTTYALGTVLAAFMAGLGLGAWRLGRDADRSSSPLRLYAVLELGIGVCGLLSPIVLAQSATIYGWCYGLLHERPALLTLARFAIGFAFVAIPAFLMGGTLPVATRYVVRRTQDIGRAVGRLYVLNTVGAAAGALLLPFALLPALGVRRTLVACGLANVAIALAAWDGARREAAVAPAPTADHAADTPPPRGLLVAFFLSGFVALALEVVWNRFFILYVGSSIYSYAVILFLYLVGIALGGALFGRLDRAGADPTRLFARCQLFVIAALAVTIPLMDRVAYLQLATLQSLGIAFGAFQLATVAAACLVVLPPTIALGVAFPAVAKAVSVRVGHVGTRLGLAYLVNTAGTTLGALAASFVLIPVLEMRATLDLLMASSAVALLAVGAPAGRAERRLGVALAAVALVASRVALPSWDARLMHLAVSKRPEAMVERFARGRLAEGLEDVHLLEMRDGVDATVSVAESDTGDRVLYVNGKPDASNGADMTNQALVGHLPVLVHPAPKRTLVIGLGSGVTAGAVARHPVESIDLIEISPEVLALADRWFETINRRVVHDPRVRVRVEDGRNFVAFDDGEPYDVIVSEPSNPWMTGVSNLFTDEFFAQLRRRLRPDGVLAQWFHYYSMDTTELRSLLGTLRRHFRWLYVFALQSSKFQGDMIVLAAERPLDFTRALTALAADDELGTELRALDVGPADLLRAFVLSSENLDAFVGDAPVNSDDHPVVELNAPRAIFRETALPNLEALHRASAGARLPLADGEALSDAFAVVAPPGFTRRGAAFRNALVPAASPAGRPLRELQTDIDFDDGNGRTLRVLGIRGGDDRAALDRLVREAAGADVAPAGEARVSGHTATLFARIGDPRRVAAWICGRSKTSYAAALWPASDPDAASATLGAIGCH